MSGTEIVPVEGLLDVQTGEVLVPSVRNAATALESARVMKDLLNDIVAAATAYLVEESARQGAKTLRAEGATVTLTGGETVEYDAQDLMGLLREVGCPEERIEQAVHAEITYKINRSVLRQLAAANEEYRAAIDLAARTVEKPYRASVRRD